MNKPIKTPRAAALAILCQLLKQQGSLASLLPDYTMDMNPRDTGLLKELCYGACRWYWQLDSLLSMLLTQQLKKKDSDIKAILVLGLYQLAFMRVAEHAAINESVKLAKTVKKPWATKLINAVLRRFQRERDTLLSRCQAECEYAHPLWLEKKIKTAWPQEAEIILSANNQHPPLSLRVNRQQQTRTDYQSVLKQAEIHSSPTPFSADGLYLESARPVSDLPLFDEGAVSVQDEAAQLAAELLLLEPGMRVLDACSAPGGKTGHIAEAEPALAELVAVDNDARRLKKVAENLARLRLQATLVCGDAASPNSWYDGQPFDRILIDVPCSATGIIRRQPDIKLLREPEHIHTITQLQWKILNALWPLLRDGGILLYASCSILPEENTDMLARFVESNTDAVHQPITATWGKEQPYGRQLLPSSSHSHDGFYYGRLVKQAR